MPDQGVHHNEQNSPGLGPQAPRVAVLIPGYDVELTVAEVVRGSLAFVEKVLVVDDGSSDGTARVAESAGAQVLRHDRNLGKGAALQSGMRRLQELGFTHAFTVDGDGQHLPAEIPVLLEACVESREAIFIGKRRREEGQEVAGIRQFGNEFANWWVSRAAGRQLPDTQSGFRIYPLEPTLGLGATRQHYDFESEILILAARRGVEIRSREVRVFYPPPDELISHYAPWLDTIRIIRIVAPWALGFRH